MSKHSDVDSLLLTGDQLSIKDVVSVARARARVTVSANAKARVDESRRWVEKVIAQGDQLPVYGVNTPFGSLAYMNVFKTNEEAAKLSRNLIISHAAGVGDFFSEDVVRAAMLIRANTLLKGVSGIRSEVIQSLVSSLNQDIYPAVPEKGSVGASGDLAPLSHLVLVITKPADVPDDEDLSGEVFVSFDPDHHDPSQCFSFEDADGSRELKCKTFAKPVMERAGIERHVLGAKEGLALNNGATFCAAMAALAVHDAELLIRNAEIALAMTLESVKGYRDAFLPQVHKARGHQGQIDCASNILRLVEESDLLDGDEGTDPKNCPPQNSYSIRCAPQVIGAVRDVLEWVRKVVETELNAATDNPLIFATEDREDDFFLGRSYKAISCGNFHGEPLAFAMDFLGIAIAELGSISERRTFRLLTGFLNNGLDSMLVHSPNERGMHNGFMIPQYTAAALVSENKTLAHPDSVDSIPTCEDQEDHVSMAANAARHTHEIIKNVQQVVGIEMLCAAQALDFRKGGWGYSREGFWKQAMPGRLGKGTRVAHECIRAAIQHWGQDRIMYPDLRRIEAMVCTGEIVHAVELALNDFKE